MKKTRQRWPSAAQIVRNGVRRAQPRHTIRRRVRQAFPVYAYDVDKLIGWAERHPDGCEIGRDKEPTR